MYHRLHFFINFTSVWPSHCLCLIN